MLFQGLDFHPYQTAKPAGQRNWAPFGLVLPETSLDQEEHSLGRKHTWAPLWRRFIWRWDQLAARSGLAQEQKGSWKRDMGGVPESPLTGILMNT